jgi:hypothetical protein
LLLLALFGDDLVRRSFQRRCFLEHSRPGALAAQLGGRCGRRRCPRFVVVVHLLCGRRRSAPLLLSLCLSLRLPPLADFAGARPLQLELGATRRSAHADRPLAQQMVVVCLVRGVGEVLACAAQGLLREVTTG